MPTVQGVQVRGELAVIGADSKFPAVQPAETLHVVWPAWSWKLFPVHGTQVRSVEVVWAVP